MKRLSLLLIGILLFGFASLHSQIPDYVPKTGLIGWWPFNGNAQDESGNGNHGTPMNGVLLSADRFANTNAAYSFDGVDDYIEILNSSSLNSPTQAITISIWFKINNWYNVDNSGWFTIMSKSNLSSSYGNYRSGLELNASGLQSFYGTFNSDHIVNTINLQLNTWNQIVYTIDDVNNLGKIYLNGILLLQGVTTYTGWTTTNTMPLILGMDQPGFVDYANGSLDDIGIWDRVLTQSEIDELYQTKATSVQEDKYNTILIYPNPTNTFVIIDYANINDVDNYTCHITNSLGQEKVSSKFTNRYQQIDISGLGGVGLYIITIKDGNNAVLETRKLLIQ